MYLADGGLALGDWIGVGGGALTILGVILSVVFYKRTKDSKFLWYSLLEDQSLETNAPFPRLVIDVSYQPASGPKLSADGDFEANGLLLLKPRIWTFKVKNMGRQAVRKIVDFQEDLEVKAVDGQIVDVWVNQVSRSGVHPLGTVLDGFDPAASVNITPNLMNSGDWMEVAVLTDGATQEPLITSWLVAETSPMLGVPIGALNREQLLRQMLSPLIYFVPSILALATGVFLDKAYVRHLPDPAGLGWVVDGFYIIALVFMIFGIVRALRVPNVQSLSKKIGDARKARATALKAGTSESSERPTVKTPS